MIKSSLIVITTLLSSSYAVKIESTQKIAIALKSQEQIRLHAGQKSADAEDGCLRDWFSIDYYYTGAKEIGMVLSPAECVQKVKEECGPEFDQATYTDYFDVKYCLCQKTTDFTEDKTGHGYKACIIDRSSHDSSPQDSYGSPYDSSYGAPYDDAYGGHSPYNNYSSYSGQLPYDHPYAGNSSYSNSTLPSYSYSNGLNSGDHYECHWVHAQSPYDSSYGGPYDSYGSPYDSYGDPYNSTYGSPYDSYNTTGPYDSYSPYADQPAPIPAPAPAPTSTYENGCLSDWVHTNAFGEGEKFIGVVSSASECVEKARAECPEFDHVNTEVGDSTHCYCQKAPNGASLSQQNPVDNSNWRTCKLR